MKHTHKLRAALAGLALAAASVANALTINQGTAFVQSGNGSAPTTATAINSLLSMSLSHLYQDTSTTSDSGTYASNYSMSFSGSDADLDWGGGANAFITGFSQLYIVVVGESAADPDWKVFNMTGGLAWDGKAQLD